MERSLPLNPDLAKIAAIELRIEKIYLERDYMEPLSLTAGAAIFILIGLANGALQRTGEILMDKSLEKGQKILRFLEDKHPDIASAIKLAAQRPELAQQQPDVYSIPALEAKVEQAAAADPDIATEWQALKNTGSQPLIVQNLGKIAQQYNAPVSIQNQNNKYEF